MNASAITNREELRTEIARLRALDETQTAELVARFSSPSAILASALSLSPRYRARKWQDPVTLLARVLIPLTLSKTVFRHSNFLTRLLGGFAAQKTAGLVTEARAANAWHSIQSLFHKIFNKKPTNSHEKSI